MTESVRRLVGIDLARGLAVLGMFAAHVGPDPQARGDLVGAALQLTHGRASALFAFLAGFSLVLIAGRTVARTGRPGRQAAVKIVIRAVILLVVGTGLTMTGTPVAVILAYYGVYFLLALPLVRLRVRTLAIVAAVTAVAGPVASYALRTWFASAGWIDLLQAKDPLVRIGGEGFLDLLLTGSYPAITWMPYVIAGMAVARLDLAAATVRSRLAVTGLCAGVAGYGSAWLISLVVAVPAATDLGSGSTETGVVPVDDPAWLLVASPHSGTTFEIAGNLGVALLVVIGALLLVDHLPKAGRLVMPITLLGTMSLSAYVGHVAGIWALDITDLPGQPLRVLVGFAAVAMVLAVMWAGAFRRGPLEHLLHRATGIASRVR